MEIHGKPIKIGVVLNKTAETIDLDLTKKLKEQGFLFASEFQSIYAMVPAYTLKVTSDIQPTDMYLVSHFIFSKDGRIINESYYHQQANLGMNIVMAHIATSIDRGNSENWYAGSWELKAEVTFIKKAPLDRSSNVLRYVKNLVYYPLAVYPWQIRQIAQVTATGEFVQPRRDTSLMTVSVNVDDI